MANLRVGMWVKLEGERALHGALSASKLRLYAGDLDEVTLESDVATVDASRLTLHTSIGVRVVATPHTEIEGPERRRHLGLALIAVGDRVKVAGQLQEDGSLLAEEIDIEDSRRQQAAPPAKDAYELRAPLESIDTAGWRIVVLGLRIQLGEETRISSSLPD
jgi:hypothetical protein